MVLFIVIAFIIFVWTLVDDESGLIKRIKFSVKSYKPIRNTLKEIWGTFWTNIGLNILNWCAVFCISLILGTVLVRGGPREYSYWQFNINALQDNMGVEGHFRYGGRGYINDELSYYYSRTLSRGELIEHIPADKTYIRYSNKEKPHVEVHQSQADIPDWVGKVFFIKWINSIRTDYYVIVAPEGTITTTDQYEIDMR